MLLLWSSASLANQMWIFDDVLQRRLYVVYNYYNLLLILKSEICPRGSLAEIVTTALAQVHAYIGLIQAHCVEQVVNH